MMISNILTTNFQNKKGLSCPQVDNSKRIYEKLFAFVCFMSKVIILNYFSSFGLTFLTITLS